MGLNTSYRSSIPSRLDCIIGAHEFHTHKTEFIRASASGTLEKPNRYP